MREIGSEFWDVPTTDQHNVLFSDSTQWFLSGRSALQAIIADLGEAKSVSLPSWCCDSMIKPFVDAHYTIDFYLVNYKNGKLVQEVNTDSDVLFLMDYFGYTSQTIDLRDYKGIVIRDVTHSLFSSNYSDADYYFGSLRKWCGVWTGGFAWTRDGHMLQTGGQNDGNYIHLRSLAMKLKSQYIEEGKGDKEYLAIYEYAEECLETVGIVSAADRDVKLAQCLDVEMIKRRRRANAEVLRSAFSDWLIFSELKPADTPMFVPILVQEGKRDVLRRNLIIDGIYCPIHWPVSKYHKLEAQERYIYDNEISLVCDQRYTQDDMYRMVEIIKKYMGDKNGTHSLYIGAI